MTAFVLIMVGCRTSTTGPVSMVSCGLEAIRPSATVTPVNGNVPGLTQSHQSSDPSLDGRNWLGFSPCAYVIDFALAQVLPSSPTSRHAVSSGSVRPSVYEFD